MSASSTCLPTCSLLVLLSVGCSNGAMRSVSALTLLALSDRRTPRTAGYGESAFVSGGAEVTPLIANGACATRANNAVRVSRSVPIFHS